MKISIITVCYNSSQTISRTIDVAPKKICCLCKECYSDLLDWLGVNDCE